MKVEVYFEQPDSDIIELNEEQEELWIEYSTSLEKAREISREQGWKAARFEYNRADNALDSLIGSLRYDLSYDLPVEDITEW